MKYSANQLAKALYITPRGAHKFAKRLGLPFSGSDYDLSGHTALEQSIELSSSLHLPAYFSLRGLSKMTGKRRGTLREILIHNNIPLYKPGRNNVILLIDLYNLRNLLTK